MSNENKNTADIHVQDALDSIAVIRQVLNRSEFNMNRMGILFLLYGLLTLISNIVSSLMSTSYIGEKGLTLEELTRRVSISNTVNFCLIWIIWAVLLFLFIRIRLSMKHTESKYTMHLFDMWGVTLFIPILANIFTPIALRVFSMDMTAVLICNLAFQMLHYGMKCMSLFITGKLTKKWAMMLISIIMLILVPVMCCADLSAIGIADASVMDRLGAEGVYTYIYSRITLATYVIIFIYIIMGIILFVRSRRDSNGLTQHTGDVSVETETDDNKCAD